MRRPDNDFLESFPKVWVASIRDSPNEAMGRVRRYFEVAGSRKRAPLEGGRTGLVDGGGSPGSIRPDLKTPPQLYNLDAVGYESILLGVFSIWRGRRRSPKPNEVLLGFSRDGFHWTRPDRKAFIPVSEHYGDWNWANVQSAGGVVMVVGDQFYFYVWGGRECRARADPGRGSVGSRPCGVMGLLPWMQAPQEER